MADEVISLPELNAYSGTADRGGQRIVIIEKGALFRECLVRCLNASAEQQILALPTVESWLELAERSPAELVVLFANGGPKQPEVRKQLMALLRSCSAACALVTDDEDLASVVEALSLGLRAYIPTSLPLQVAVEAMRLVMAGGIFVPASSILSSTEAVQRPAPVEESSPEIFTTRQAAVVEALRRGKANKIIAYELNMRESTVKVHVRNIMKKLNAKNRTEVAYMTNGRRLDASASG